MGEPDYCAGVVNAEESHESGRIGAFAAKRFLDGTARLQVPWNGYENAGTTTIRRPDGSKKKFDLRGYFTTEPHKGHTVYIESKHCSSDHGLKAEFEAFLVDAYCGHLTADEPRHFMFVTWNPFSAGKWSDLMSFDYVDSVLKASEPFKDKDLDPTDLLKFCDRLWLLVVSDAQIEHLIPEADVMGEIARFMTNREASKS